jgi:uncharacterized SAM-binding protein YcdF (DUF218 family)
MKAAVVIAGGLVVAGLVGVLSLGFWLSPQSRVQTSDAIVAISGGETDMRADEAVRLFQAGWAPSLIFSGAARDPRGPSNALAMKRQAVAAGVAEEHITIEEASVNTAENAAAVAKIARDRGWHRLILVTSPYHQRRAYLTFKHELPGIEIINHSAVDHSWRRSAWWANPQSYQLTLSELQKTLFLLVRGR